MYVENAQGWHDQIAELFGLERSIKPMNIRYEDWAALGFEKVDLLQPRLNVRAAVYASESARSKAEAREFRLSKSQQAEDLLALLAKGMRNL